MGTFFKQIYRYTHPRPFRHNENLWPYVKFVRAQTGEITRLVYKKQNVPLIDLAALKGKHQGDILLTATGPSVNDIAFEKFPAMPAIGVNGSYFLRDKVNYSYYIIVDMGFIDKKPEIIRDVINDGNITLFTTVHGITKIIDAFTLEKVKCKLAAIEDASFRIYQPRTNVNDIWQIYHNNPNVIFAIQRKDIAFNKDIRDGIFDAGTVVYWAMQIITYLGFNQLFIVGLDMNNFDKPRFYESYQDKLPTFLADKVESLILPAFHHASKVMSENKITIKNLSLNSSISTEIFTKADYNELFK